METFDYVVIGAGSAGCVVANRLSADASVRVLLLEAGPADDSPHIRTRDYGTGYLKTWGTDLDWQLETEPQPGLKGRKVMITQGRVLGGGSSVHAMMYVRGDRMDYDFWNALGNEGWGYEDVLPLFKKSEDYAHGADAIHGVGGPMKGMKCPNLTPAAEAYMAAAAELGMEGGPHVDLNAEERENRAGIMQFNFTADGLRSSASSAFLTPIRDRKNLTVWTGAEVSAIQIENRRAAGVEFVRRGSKEYVRVGREVILSAGAYLSPKILMLSGVGPAEHLKALKIHVLADLPGVGENLQDHMRLMVAFKSRKDLPLPTTVAEVGMFARSRPGIVHAAPDLQINFSAGVPGFVPAEYPFSGPHSIFVPILLQAQSRGTVRLRSTDPREKPVVDPNYLSCDIDLRTYRRGVEICRELASTRAFSDFNAGEICPSAAGDVDDYIRRNATTIWHPAGTCRMGWDAMAVVDPALRVHGVEGLRVADASVMPLVTSGNTNAPCVMIGEKAAELILGKPV